MDAPSVRVGTPESADGVAPAAVGSDNKHVDQFRIRGSCGDCSARRCECETVPATSAAAQLAACSWCHCRRPVDAADRDRERASIGASLGSELINFSALTIRS
jgi:hypothetical protein